MDCCAVVGWQLQVDDGGVGDRLSTNADLGWRAGIGIVLVEGGQVSGIRLEEVESEQAFAFGFCIEGADVPGLTAPAGDHGIFTDLAVEHVGIIPNGGQLLNECELVGFGNSGRPIVPEQELPRAEDADGLGQLSGVSTVSGDAWIGPAEGVVGGAGDHPGEQVMQGMRVSRLGLIAADAFDGHEIGVGP